VVISLYNNEILSAKREEGGEGEPTSLQKNVTVLLSRDILKLLAAVVYLPLPFVAN
jgi:hypothetical protein